MQMCYPKPTFTIYHTRKKNPQGERKKSNDVTK